MTRILAMKITVTTHQTVKHLGKDHTLSGSFSVVPVAGEAAFWDPEQPDQHDYKDPHLRLSFDYFNVCLHSAAPLDDRVQIELAKRGSLWPSTCIGSLLSGSSRYRKRSDSFRNSSRGKI